MNLECILCCEESAYFGVTECNHGPFCYRCIYKMRAINKNNSCPICKHKTNQIMISQQFCKFGQFKGEILQDSNFSDVYHCGPQAKKEFQKLKQYKCFVKINNKPCKYQKSFDNIAFLKKHLKQEHKRVLCDICVEKKTCVLEQQKLYTQAQLNKHMQRGDIDDFGNVIFLHPYCFFCKIYFFDEDQFKRHMGLEHMICNVCGPENKYIFYKNYDSLETHYKISHYICSDINCLAKKFIAFRSAEQLKIHKSEIHGAGGKKIDGKQLCGFNYGGIIQQDVIEIKDKQGIDMQDQFLTLKKSKNQALGEADKQNDTIIDLRDFYASSFEEEDHFHESFVLKHKVNKDGDQPKGQNKKKKYIQKQQFEKEKPQFAKQNEQFTIEDLNLIKTFHLSKLKYDDFQAKLENLLGSQDLKKFDGLRTKYNKRQLSPQQFLDNFYSIMKKVSLKTAYQIFPHYLRTLQHQGARQQLEQQYIRSLKSIPTKTKCMLSRCKNFSQLFKQLLKQIEKNIENRIRTETLSLKKPILREKQRLFQLIGVVRRLKTQQMAKFKFASNFGVQLDTSEMIHEKIFKMNQENIQSRLDKIPNQEFIDLYVFVKHCFQAVTHNQNMHLAKNKIHEKVLEDYLFERPELEKKYGPKKQDFKTLDEKVEFEKQQEEKNHKKKLKDLQKKNKQFGYHAKTNFSLNDKNDFPDLIIGKTESEEKRQNYRDVIEAVKNKPATFEKKINQLFPTLGGEPESPSKKAEKDKGQEKKEKAWWEKLNEPSKVDIEQGEEVVKVRKGKNKKQKWVSAKGFF